MKNYYYQIRLTQREYDRLKEQASRAGVSRAVFLRNMLRGDPVVDAELAEVLRKLTVELSRIGNNINQVARKWNEKGADAGDLSFLDSKMGEILVLVREVRKYCYHTYSDEGR